MRLAAQFTAAGLAGVILWELLSILMPFLTAIFFGVMLMLFKFALVMVAIFGVMAWIKKRANRLDDDSVD
jgi:asparagine N-glycosylation enzyme membrane subunit Stt3